MGLTTVFNLVGVDKPTFLKHVNEKVRAREERTA